jgi:hypothetical protein
LIAEVKARRNFNKQFAKGLLGALATHIKDFHYRQMATENGGLATNLTEKAVDRLAERVYLDTQQRGLSKDEARLLGQTLTALDYGINEDITLGDPELQHEIEAEVQQLVGMRTVRKFFTVMKTKAQYVEKGGDPQTLRTSLNMVLTGNPGTGKTTIARKIARYLHAFGVLPTDRFVERNGLELKGQYTGQTAPTVKQMVSEAMGGCLFIDEVCVRCSPTLMPLPARSIVCSLMRYYTLGVCADRQRR